MHATGPSPTEAAERAQVVQNVAEAAGCTAEVDFLEASEPLFLPTINHPDAHKFAVDVGTRLLGKDRVFPDWPPTMGAEDFSFFQQPGLLPFGAAYIFLGQGDKVWRLLSADHVHESCAVDHLAMHC